jgi:serine/threonine-protein kinase
MPIEPGQMLAHYRLVEKIGEGGMGVVWKATDTTLDREVAIKVLPETLAGDAERLARFEREAKLLASLNHPRIASLYGLHETGGQRFLSMELIGGQDLADVLTAGPLAIERALRIALQIAEGLEVAHARGIVHRDLKPGNVKLTADGDVKILDFGLAKALEGPAPSQDVDLSRSPTMTVATRVGVLLGTAAYMSPEQSRGDETDRRTDVWALGCVLYEMLTGRGAFHARTASDCIARVLERDPDWDLLPAETPAGVRRLLQRCLAKDPRRRLHDVADVRIELEDLLAADGSEPTPAPSRVPRRATTWLGVAAGLVVGALATAWWLSGGNAPAASGNTGVGSPKRFSIALPDEVPAIPKPGTMAVTVSPDGRRIVYVGLEPGSSGARAITRDGSPSGSSGRTVLYVRDIDDYELRPIEGTAGAPASPFFSPDGEWIGFIDTHEARLKKIRVEGGVPVTLCDAPNRAGHWGADGRIYFSSTSDGIFAVSENGGAPELLSPPRPELGEKTRRFPHVLPGGRGVLFTLGTTKMESYDEADIALLDPETGEHRVLLEGGMKPSYLPTGHLLYGRGGALYAIRFDLDTLEVSGAPFLVADDVVTSDGWGEAQYAVSDAGTLVYVPGGPEIYKFTVYWLDPDGEAEALPLPSRDYASALFSPDGKRLAITSLGANATIWVYEIERRTMLRLTTEWDHYAVVWTRAGEHVTAASGRAGRYGFWNVAADGSGAEKLLLDTGTDGGYPGAWTLDDRTLVYAMPNPGTGLDILTLTVNGTAEVTPLLQTSFQESSPSLSPDGRWLAYVSDASGQSELYVQRYPEGGRRWQISAGGGGTPRWSRDGRELYYWKGGRMMQVSVNADGGEFSPGQERALPQPEFSALVDWDISPDGEGFVVVGRLATMVTADNATVTNASPNRVEARVPEIRVVTDWFEELRDKR